MFNARTVSKKTIIPTIAATLIGTTLLAGCTRMGGLRARMAANELAHTVQIDGDPITVGRLNAITIENPNGNVRVVARSRHEEAKITFRVQKERQLRWRAARMGLDFDPVGEYFTAVHDNNGELSTLIVRATDLDVEGYRPPIDLTVYIPQCDGLEVRNANGKIEIIGVNGVIHAESGNDTLPGGSIEIRTDRNDMESIHATSNHGHVTLVTGPNSGGTIELIAPRGKTTFNSRYGTVDHSMPSVGHWTGIWNDGTNEIKLTAEDGNAIVRVVENPTMYTPNN